MPEPAMDPLQYVLEIEPLDLGADVKAVALNLVELESREPAHGSDAHQIWSASLTALPGTDPWLLDFFAHLDRVREYCVRHAIPFEEKSSGHLLTIPAPGPDLLAGLIARFADETFGVRAGERVLEGDRAVESDLARRGVDGYHAAFRNYLYCAVCDFESGFLTLITERLWTSEVLRRVKPAVAGLAVEVGRPQ
jgi:hypothetical protein